MEESAESIKKKIENTMELTLNQEIPNDDQESSAIEQEILSQDTFEETDELNISDLFSIDETKEIKTPTENSLFTVDEIINALIQTDKKIHSENKKKWLTKNNIADSTNRQLINLLDKTNLIASSKDFILLESQDVYAIKEINRIREESSTMDLIVKLLETPKIIFAITKEEFGKIKDTWIQLAQSNSLPEPKPIQPPLFKEENKNQAKHLGNSIFGDIFKS